VHVRVAGATWLRSSHVGAQTYRELRYVWVVAVIALDHIQLAAPPGCEEAARAFYGDLLGLVEIEKPDLLRGRGGVWFALGEQQLHIGVEEQFRPALKAHPALRVAAGQLDELAGRLSEAGVQVQWDDELPGVRRFFSADPWGNRIELCAAAAAGSTRPPGE
jgi:catechol 2,3-dioxygenase-like lactoylglutathione lyase family enzyme